MGKLCAKDLQKMLDCIKPDERVLLPPMIGYDSGIHSFGEKLVVIGTDPCTGVPEEWFGWLLVNYAASDVALSGTQPQFCTITLLGPKSTSTERFQKIMLQTCKSADELGIAIVRGHTGTYDSLNDLMGVCTVYGITDSKKLITSGGAQAGDLLFCTKPLGLETVTNYSLSHSKVSSKLFGEIKQKELAGLVRMQSCVKEALALAQIGDLHAMHDATEGGFIAALNELSTASNLGFRIQWNEIPILPEIFILQKMFRLSEIQLLSMSSTGTIIGAVSPESKKELTSVLKKQSLIANFLGEFTEKKERILVKNDLETKFPSTANDPFATIMGTH
jgi:hydrogenase expression/formation protein HypE